MGNTTVNRQVNIFITSGEAEKAYDKLIKKEQQLKDELTKATDPKIIARLNSELNKLAEPIDRANKKLKGELAPSIRELTNTQKALNREFQLADIGSKRFHELSVQIASVNTQLDAAKLKARGVDQALSQQSGHGNFLTKIGTGLNNFSESTFGVGFGAAAGTLAAGALLKTSFEEALKAEEGIARLKATLDNVGKSDSFDRLAKSAENFAKQFSFIDNDEVINVFNKLITYGKLTEEQVSKVTPVIINFASKQRISLEESTDIIIRALEGNGRALKTYGINIKDTGSEADRFTEIMDVLGKKVEGAAEAFGETTSGKLKSSKQRLLDLAETIGDKLLPVINLLAQAFEFVVIGAEDVINRISDAFELVFNNIAFTARKAEDALKKLQNEGVDEALANLGDISKKSFDELNKTLEGTFKNLNLYRSELEKSNKELEAFNKNHKLTSASNAAERQLILNTIEANKKLIAGQKAVTDAINAEFDRRRDAANRLAGTIKELQQEIQKVTEVRDNAVIGTKEFNDANARLLILQKRLDELTNKKKAAAKENLNDQFIKQLEAQKNELEAFNKQQVDRDLANSQNKFDKQAEQFKDALKKGQLTIDEFGARIEDSEFNRLAERHNIIHKFALDALAKQDEENKKSSDKQKLLDAERMKALQASSERLAVETAKVADKNLKGRSFELEVQAMTAKGKKLLAIRIEQLDNERAAEIRNAQVTGELVSSINKKFDNLIHDAKIESLQSQIKEYTDFASNISNLLTNVFSAQNQRDQADLENLRAQNDKKKKLYENDLNNKLISRQEYDRKVSALDKQVEAKEKQVRLAEFNRQKIVSILNATISTAEAVASALKLGPFYAAFIGSLGAIQIGLIASQKPPKFAKGGKLEGPLHSQGGMPIINPQTGRKIAEIEGGEVILSRSTYHNNRSMIDQLLHSSLHRNGAPVVPAWRQRSPTPLNLPAISNSLNMVRMFDKGGIVTTQAQGQQPAIDTGVLEDLRDVLVSLQQNGIPAFVLLSQFQKQQDRVLNIKNDALVR